MGKELCSAILYIYFFVGVGNLATRTGGGGGGSSSRIKSTSIAIGQLSEYRDATMWYVVVCYVEEFCDSKGPWISTTQLCCI